MDMKILGRVRVLGVFEKDERGKNMVKNKGK